MPSGNILGKLVNFIQDQKPKWPLFYLKTFRLKGTSSQNEQFVLVQKR